MEVIFVSSDSSEESFESYYAEMPWLALPYRERAAVNALMSTAGVYGIPSVISVRCSDGAIVSTNGKHGVQQNPGDFPWGAVTEGGVLTKVSGDPAQALSKAKLSYFLPIFLVLVAIAYIFLGAEYRTFVLVSGFLGFLALR